MSCLSDRLAKVRNDRNLTQQKVVDMTKGQISTAQVLSNYESGKRAPDYETLCSLAKVYCVSTDYLLGFSNEEVPGVKDVSELTGLSPKVIGHLANRGEVATFINAIFDSEELSDIYQQSYLIQNMMERIANTKSNCIASGERYLPDDEYTVRIPSEDFFAFHSYKFGSYIASAIAKWAIQNCGIELFLDDEPNF